MSMVRTCARDEEGILIPGTGPSDFRFWLHEFLDDRIFYPVRDSLQRIFGDSKSYQILRVILGFFWGLNCGFPLRDITLYAIWEFKGCPPLAVFKKKEGKWVKTYPDFSKVTQ